MTNRVVFNPIHKKREGEGDGSVGKVLAAQYKDPN